MGKKKDRKAAEKRKQKAMLEAAQSYQAMRPMMQDARMNALRGTLGLMQPANNLMGQMYGQGAMLDIGQALQDPVSQEMFAVGQPRPWQQPDPRAKGVRRGAGIGAALGAIFGGPIGMGMGAAGGAGVGAMKGSGGSMFGPVQEPLPEKVPTTRKRGM